MSTMSIRSLGKHSCLLILMLLSSIESAYSQEIPTAPVEIQDTWGSILYCQALYEEPQIKGRVYPGDHEDCRNADALMRWSISRGFGLADQAALEKAAKAKSRVIRHNTRDTQAAVQACREQCRVFARMYEEKTASGEISTITDPSVQ
jgi:hypothetical protein